MGMPSGLHFTGHVFPHNEVSSFWRARLTLYDGHGDESPPRREIGGTATCMRMERSPIATAQGSCCGRNTGTEAPRLTGTMRAVLRAAGVTEGQGRAELRIKVMRISGCWGK